jgi:hypothetical protein
VSREASQAGRPGTSGGGVAPAALSWWRTRPDRDDLPEEEPVNTAVGLDPSDKLRAYAHPERLVSAAWLAEHLDDPNLVVAESDEDVLLYETGHIPGAVKIDWHLDLNDPV